MVQTPGIVVVYAPSSRYRRAHQQATCSKVAHRLAGLHNFDFAGPFEPSKSYPGPVVRHLLHQVAVPVRRIPLCVIVPAATRPGPTSQAGQQTS
jgi:hypothetical protein